MKWVGVGACLFAAALSVSSCGGRDDAAQAACDKWATAATALRTEGVTGPGFVSSMRLAANESLKSDDTKVRGALTKFARDLYAAEPSALDDVGAINAACKRYAR